MEDKSERSNFEYWEEHSPERKIELIGGRLIVGNSLAGSRLLLDHILRGWSVDAATSLGSVDHCRPVCSMEHMVEVDYCALHSPPHQLSQTDRR